MKIVDIDLTTLDHMAAIMRAEHYVGFLQGAAILALIDTSDTKSTTDVQTFMAMRDDFVLAQRDKDEPTGLPVAPVYWTDVDTTPCEDEIEATGGTGSQQAFLLCSSVEPYARWAVKHYHGEDDLTFYRDRAHAEKGIEEMRIAHRMEFDRVLADVKRLYRLGDTDGADRAMQDFDFEISIHEEGVEITIEGERIKIGCDKLEPGIYAMCEGGIKRIHLKPGEKIEVKGGHVEFETIDDKITPVHVRDVPPGLAVSCEDSAMDTRAENIEDVKKALRGGHRLRAETLAKNYGLTFSWYKTNPHVALIDGEHFTCPNVTGNDSPRDVPPGLAVPCEEPVVDKARASAIERVKAHLRAGEGWKAEDLAQHSGISFRWSPEAFVAHIDGEIFNFSGTPHGL